MKDKTLILVLAAILLITLGAFSYLLASGNLTSRVPYETSIREMEVQSDSTEIDEIEKDLEATNLNDIDKELSEIEAEIGSSE
ncbi:MAG TPA: hypothetical protein VJ481_03490 [Patescibacteria group bacterium]|uniref:Uncharacterized protein n=1 Tax=Candidatus Woesebacteria bacterium RBG_13_46_13 TaxID=1802479 RepID=A0A1F7X434_9BACT|nr:MAG: hypothetical protein A2Y68_03340 [Candidatus Woesebacteria bacterium RBG_13_46_13]HJX59592.1 hypothetical protein [Patescibacteria group bacterium]